MNGVHHAMSIGEIWQANRGVGGAREGEPSSSAREFRRLLLHDLESSMASPGVAIWERYRNDKAVRCTGILRSRRVFSMLLR